MQGTHIQDDDDDNQQQGSETNESRHVTADIVRSSAADVRARAGESQPSEEREK